MGYMRAGWRVTSVDLDANALELNPADVTVKADALEYFADRGHRFDAVHISCPCQRWAANGGNPAASKWPDLITPARALLEASGLPYVMENVSKAPLRRDLILCGSMFGLTATDTDGTTLHLRRHRVFESNITLTAPGPCVHPRGVQWAGVYGGARKDKVEARTVRRGGYVPPDATIQSTLLGGVPWMSAKGRRECIPPIYSFTVGRLLMSALTGYEAANVEG